MSATVEVASALEEDCESAVRIALGLRPAVFESNDAAIDPRPCPQWCHYGLGGHDHEINPRRPFDAHHSLGVGPEVALSRYAGTWHRPTQDSDSYKTASRLRVLLGQDGGDAPVVTLALCLDDRSARPDQIELSVSDARDLIIALQYVVDLTEGRRTVVEGAE